MSVQADLCTVGVDFGTVGWLWTEASRRERRRTAAAAAERAGPVVVNLIDAAGEYGLGLMRLHSG